MSNVTQPEMAELRHKPRLAVSPGPRPHQDTHHLRSLSPGPGLCVLGFGEL